MVPKLLNDYQKARQSEMFPEMLERLETESVFLMGS
jgi:hypothetical protein